MFSAIVSIIVFVITLVFLMDAYRKYFGIHRLSFTQILLAVVVCLIPGVSLVALAWSIWVLFIRK